MNLVYNPSEHVDEWLFDVSHFQLLGNVVEHSHGCVEITLIVRGRAEHRINGEMHHAYPGCLYLFYPGSTHEFLNPCELELYNVSCSPDFLGIFGAQLLCLKNFEALFGGQNSALELHLSGLLFHDISTLIKEMYQLFVAPERGEQLGTLRSMFSVFLILMTQSELPTQQSARNDLKQAVRFMERRYAEVLTLKELAKLCCMSPNHFMRKFKEEFGSSPMRYLHDLRLEQAKHLLSAHYARVTETALQCGFSSGCHLSREFSRKYGLTITQFRKSESPQSPSATS